MGESALLDGIGVVLGYGGQTAIEHGLIGFLEQYRDAGICEHHGDPSAHGSGAHHGGALHWNLRRVFGDAGDLPHFAVAEENVDQRLGLIREKAFLEQLGLALHAFVERKLGGGFDRVDGRLGRQ